MNPEGMNPSQDELMAAREANNAPQRAAEAARLEALQQAEAAGVPVVRQVEGYGAGTPATAAEQSPEQQSGQQAA